MLKVQGMGHIPSKNAVPGDLLLTVIVKKHPSIKRKGTTLYNKLDISIIQAIKGDKVLVEGKLEQVTFRNTKNYLRLLLINQIQDKMVIID